MPYDDEFDPEEVLFVDDEDLEQEEDFGNGDLDDDYDDELSDGSEYEISEPISSEYDPSNKLIHGKKSFYTVNDVAGDVATSLHSVQIIRDSEDIFTFKTDVLGDVVSASFTGRNSWNSWKLIPSSRPIIAPPEFRSSYIEIPGADGLLDVSTVLSGGHPLYGRRKGQIEFYVTRDYDGYNNWSKAYSAAMAFLHGQLVKCILLDDPYYYYRGRMTVNQWRSEKDWSKITLDYDFEPYKYCVFSSIDDWLWDPFDFAEGIITDPADYAGPPNGNYGGARIGKHLGYYADTLTFKIIAGSMRINPTIKVIAGGTTYLTFTVYKVNSDGSRTQIFTMNKSCGSAGTYTFGIYEASIKNGTFEIDVTGQKNANGTATGFNYCDISVIYRYGSL